MFHTYILFTIFTTLFKKLPFYSKRVTSIDITNNIITVCKNQKPSMGFCNYYIICNDIWNFSFYETH